MNQSENSPRSANSEDISEQIPVQDLLYEEFQRQKDSAHSAQQREQSRESWIGYIHEESKEENKEELKEEEEVKGEQEDDARGGVNPYMMCEICNRYFNLSTKKPVIMRCCQNILCEECYRKSFPSPYDIKCPFRCNSSSIQSLRMKID